MGVAVSKGFLIFAQNTTDVDYVRQAYALALSIKASQHTIYNVSIVTNSTIPEQYVDVFDNIIPIPWFKESIDDPLAGEHRWKLYHASPYDETIVLDADMLMLEDISIWWLHCANYDIKFCSRIKNHKLEAVTDTFHRKAFISNNLTNPYFALHYFKKSDTAHEFYKILEFVCNNWAWCYEKFAPNHYQHWLSMDLATAIAIEISGFHEQAIDSTSPFEFIHMKSPIQGWDTIHEDWQNGVPHIFTATGHLVIGNIRQSKLCHYVEKNFITDDILKKLEGLVHGS